ncbi:Hsp70 family protein, partial [Streptomyces sp. NRRL S-87]|uniref:Hsp70 family protein n=1 Tax=Streptomyces sp. NRRL S-87 TaxID=1463920 RepID=UPI0004C18158
FDIDANGIMHVTAKDLGTGKEQKMTVTGGSSLPRQDIDRMVREAEQHAEEDRRRKEAAETRNHAEQLAYSTEKILADNQDKIPADVRSDVQGAIAEVREKLEGEDTAALRASTDNLARLSQRVGEALYARQPDDQAASGPTDAGRAPQDDEVVDAEIVDDDHTGRSAA